MKKNDWQTLNKMGETGQGDIRNLLFARKWTMKASQNSHMSQWTYFDGLPQK